MKLDQKASCKKKIPQNKMPENEWGSKLIFKFTLPLSSWKKMVIILIFTQCVSATCVCTHINHFYNYSNDLLGHGNDAQYLWIIILLCIMKAAGQIIHNTLMLYNASPCVLQCLVVYARVQTGLQKGFNCFDILNCVSS